MSASAIDADHFCRKPPLASDQVSKVAERRIASIGLELVPGRAQRRQIRDEERVDASQVIRRQGIKYSPVQRARKRGSHAACSAVQGVERWQLEALADQLLNGHVDQILEVVFGADHFT